MSEKTTDIQEISKKVESAFVNRSDVFWNHPEKGEQRLEVAKAVWDGCSRELASRFGVKAEEFDSSKFMIGKLGAVGGTFDAKTKMIILNEDSCDDLKVLAKYIAHEMGHYYAFNIRNDQGEWVRLGIAAKSPQQELLKGKTFDVFNEAVTETTMMSILSKVAGKDTTLGYLGSFMPTAYFEARDLMWEMIRNIESATNLEITADDLYKLVEEGVWGRDGGFGGLQQLRGWIERVYGREGRVRIEKLTAELGKPSDKKVRSATQLQELIRNPE